MVKKYLIILGVSLLGSVFFSFAVTSSAQAVTLDGRSPTPDLFLLSEMGKNGNNISSHYIINTGGIGNAPSNTFGVYFDDDPTGQQTIQFITQNNQVCSTSGVTVAINGLGGSFAPACNGSVRNYSISSGQASYDSNTNKYRVIVTVSLTSGALSYRLSATGSAKIGNINSNSINYGILPDEGKYQGSHSGDKDADGNNLTQDRNEGYFSEANLSFGLPCSENFSIRRTVTVYDADNRPGMYNPIRYRIFEDGNLIAGNRYQNLSNVTYDTGGSFLQPVATPGNQPQTSSLTIDMQKGKHYTLKVWNIWRPYGDSTSDTGRNHINRDVFRRDVNNFLSFSLPGDAIYGDNYFNCGYTLIPSIESINTSIDPGSTVPVRGSVNKSGIPDSNETDLRITKILYPSGTDLSLIDGKSLENNREPCNAVAQVRGYAPGDCDDVWKHEPRAVFAVDGDNPVSKDYDVPNTIGKRVCFVVSVYTRTDDPASGWANSKMECSIIAKRPKVQFLGSDIRVQGKISASLSEGINGKTYGSWMEYGAFSFAGNSTASSGGGLRGGNPNNLAGKRQWSGLTFANTGDPYGNYGTITKANNGAYFKGIAPTGTISAGPSSLPAGSGVYMGAGNITVSASTINEKGNSIIIQTTGTVTITGDLTVADELRYADAKEISQVVIVAGKIDIRSNVSRVDAWLIADTINTCSDRPTLLTVNAPCEGRLTVNGPVDTNNLQLNRTFGATAENPEFAAEIFNLRPSVYMWAYNYINQQDRARTTYVTELAPRL